MRMFAIAALIASGALATIGYASADTAGTPLDHTNWENDACHFQVISFFTADAPGTPVSLDFEGDDLGWTEDYSVSGNGVTISPNSVFNDDGQQNDSFTGTFDATTLTGTHAWTDEGGSHTENCTYTRAKF